MCLPACNHSRQPRTMKLFALTPAQSLCLIYLCVASPSLIAADMRPSDITFQTDVMAVLSKAGCNAGTCHGNLNGKGGFRLSLRGQNAQQDYFAMVDAFAGRRIDRLRPDQSLLLLKPTGQIAHQGGRRFGKQSQEYRILRDWIAQGTAQTSSRQPVLQRIEVSPLEQSVIEPASSVQLAVHAVFSDQSRRDVTSLAVYETSNLLAEVDSKGRVTKRRDGETTVLVRFLDQQVPVRLAFIPHRADFQWVSPPENNYVDRFVNARLKQLRMNPSPLADDHTFVRRAFLDAIGIMPSGEQAREFVNDTRPDKRDRLIDYLLAHPALADHWALKWSDLLRNEEKVLDPRGVDEFYQWIRSCFASGRSLDVFVRRLIAARGSTYKNPPANYYRALRDPLSRAENTARLFLGQRLQCAKCHNHPFDRWTQDDYYSWASLFARVDYDILENKRKDRLDKNEFNGEQIVLVKSTGEVKNPSRGAVATPRFLGHSGGVIDNRQDRLHVLADWLTSRDNHQFARAQTNRIFYHVFGRGLVEPVDDFRTTNLASVPGLLDVLAADFVECGFDLRHLVRVLMQSSTYQRSSIPNETNQDDERNLSRAIVRRLPAEKILDAQCQVLGVTPQLNGYENGIRAGQLPGVLRVRLRDKKPAPGDRFLMTFGKPRRFMSCECERSDETTLTQALMLISGEGMHQRLTNQNNNLQRYVDTGMAPVEMVETLYWSALARPPSDAERDSAVRYLREDDDCLASLQDFAWALLNSKEFLFRH